jgi:hypothetical protein
MVHSALAPAEFAVAEEIPEDVRKHHQAHHEDEAPQLPLVAVLALVGAHGHRH